MSASDQNFKMDTSEDNSSTSTSTFTTETNTRATTPDSGIAFNYRTIPVAVDDVSGIKSLEAAFINSEELEVWSCAFCRKEQRECKCQAWWLEAESVPSTKRDFVEYLDSQGRNASALQASLASYLLAIEKHVPFGLSFNIDQKRKCGTMDQQLEFIRERVADLKTASELLDSDEIGIPEGIRKACAYVECLLANCAGNARENHVCLKLNFTLAQDGNSQKLLNDLHASGDSKGG
ncbi:hypothetical protein MMC10_006412 [Thelotrema lepadinum]|nr:hypothetical protein [Thelotrema lepadinum]